MYELDKLEAAFEGSCYAGKLHYAALTGSTNEDAIAAARRGAAHGTVFFADAQSAGRGRGDHRWSSPSGDGLYVSVLLRPSIPATRLALLSLATGLAAMEAIRAVAGVDADLRWPNDVLIGERKVGGILVESHLSGASVEYAVAGVGINVHQREFAPGLATPATSLDMECGRRVSRQEMLVSLLKSLEIEANALSDSDAAQGVLRRVEAASTWITGREVEVHGPQACVGVTAGLDASGFLMVKSGDRVIRIQTGGLRGRDAACN